MDIDPKTFPSRTFARFMAHNQLMADATGRPIVAAVQRLGGKTFTQEVVPDGQAPTITQDSGFQMGMSVNTTPLENVPQRDDLAQSAPTPPDELADCHLEALTAQQGIDETLFGEVVKNTINSNRFPELYQSCGTQEAAMEVEAVVAAEIVAAYRRIKQKQDCPIVQGLNKLL